MDRADANQLWNLLASVQIGVWEWHVATDHVSWSEHVEQLFGLPSGAFGQTYDAYLATIAPEDRSLVARRVEEVLSGHRDGYELEHRIVWADGSVHWLACTARAFRDDAGQLVTIGGTVVDITRRKRAEEAVRESDELLRSAMDFSPIGMAIASPTGSFIDVNPAFCRLVGYTRDELLAQDSISIAFDDDRPAARALHADILAGRTSTAQFETRYLHKQGHPIWAQVNASLVRESDGTPRYFIAQIHDITERHAAELALRSNEQMLRQVTENLREVVWLLDLETGDLLYLSPAFERVLKLPRGDHAADLMARWFAAIHPDDRARAEAANASPMCEQEVSYRLVDPDGTIRWIHCRTFPIHDANGRVRRSVGLAEDITERRRFEHEIHNAQKMEAFGQLAGGVAHDFNNLLAVILPHTELVARARDLDPRVAESIAAISTAAERAATLTRQLLQLGRREVLQPTDLDLNEEVTGFASMLRRVLREDVSLQVTLAPALPPISADANMLGQVMMNLALNARDAMPDGGTLTLTTSAVTLTDDDARQIACAHAGSYCCIEVTDTGQGIAPADQPRLFEPFFTTKPRGKGTGLGLATVRGIVLQHGGCISVRSTVGHGTTLRILLPALARERERIQVPKPPRIEPRRGNEHVLVVEDEAAVRATTVHVLAEHGYQVTAAVDAADALGTLHTHGSEIALVITDLVMPGTTSGRELVTQVLAKWPHIRVVLMSGYSPDVFGRQLELRAGDHFVSKPVTIDRLLEVVRASLDHV